MGCDVQAYQTRPTYSRLAERCFHASHCYALLKDRKPGHHALQVMHRRSRGNGADGVRNEVRSGNRQGRYWWRSICLGERCAEVMPMTHGCMAAVVGPAAQPRVCPSSAVRSLTSTQNPCSSSFSISSLLFSTLVPIHIHPSLQWPVRACFRHSPQQRFTPPPPIFHSRYGRRWRLFTRFSLHQCWSCS